MNRIKQFTLSIFFAWLAFPGITQEHPSHLTLQQAIDTALRNNEDLTLAELDEKIAASRFRETSAIFLPQVDFSYTALTTNNPLNAFGFKLQQQTVKQSDFNPELLNNPGSRADFMTKIQVQQPLINLDMFYLRKAAAKESDLYHLKSIRTREYIVFAVQKAYMQLQLARDAVVVLEEALQTARSMYSFTNNRVEQGLLQKSDALNVQVHVTSIETKLAEANSNVKNAADYLSLVMGKEYGIVYQTDPLPREAPATSLADTTVPVNRADFAAMQKAIEASELVIQSGKKSYLPKLNAFAAYQLNDAAVTGFGANSYLAGIQLSWNIFRGNSLKNKISTQQLQRNKLAEELNKQQRESQLELNKTRRQLADAAYRINQQQAAVQQAAEALRILEDRYEQGLVNSTDVLLAQTQLAQQKLELVQAFFQYNLTAAYAKFLTTNTK
jgi:outer membrane protein TolC